MPTFDRPLGAAAIRRKTDSICGAQGAFGDQCGPGGPKGNPNRQVVGTLLPLWLVYIGSGAPAAGWGGSEEP